MFYIKLLILELMPCCIDHIHVHILEVAEDEAPTDVCAGQGHLPMQQPRNWVHCSGDLLSRMLEVMNPDQRLSEFQMGSW